MMKKALRLAAAILAVSVLAVPGQAQGGPVCSVNTDTITPNCSTQGWLSGVTCQHRTISCPATSGVTLNDLGITFGYRTPTGTVKGTIVFFSVLGGTQPEQFPGGEGTYASDYYHASYQIVQTAWDSDWEDTGTSTKNIAYAAGRVAAFLNWVNTNLYVPIHNSNPLAGMCIQGTSAGGSRRCVGLGLV